MIKMANEAVLNYLVDTNRPYSCADVTVNLRGAHPKSAIQKALDFLAESGKIKCKVYGKQKVYAALQLQNVEETNDAEDYDTQISSLTNIVNNKNTDLKKAEINLKNLVSVPTNTIAKSNTEEIITNVDKLEKKLHDLRNTVEIITANDKRKIFDEHQYFLKEYRKRKRICNEMLETVLEGYPKSKKNLLEELCIETDEIVSFELTIV